MPKQIDDYAVYDATIRTLLEHGYAGATTKRIAAAADISEMTLFRKYGSKPQLMAAAVNHHAFREREHEVAYTGDVVADLLSIIQLDDSSREADKQLFPLIFSEMARYPELRDVLLETITSVQKLGEIMARYQAEGVLRYEHPLHTIGALLGPLVVNNMLRNAQLEGFVPPIDFVEHVRQFLAGRLRAGAENEDYDADFRQAQEPHSNEQSRYTGCA